MRYSWGGSREERGSGGVPGEDDASSGGARGGSTSSSGSSGSQSMLSPLPFMLSAVEVSLGMGRYGGHFLLQGGEFQRFGNH